MGHDFNRLCLGHSYSMLCVGELSSITATQTYMYMCIVTSRKCANYNSPRRSNYASPKLTCVNFKGMKLAASIANFQVRGRAFWLNVPATDDMMMQQGEEIKWLTSVSHTALSEGATAQDTRNTLSQSTTFLPVFPG